MKFRIVVFFTAFLSVATVALAQQPTLEEAEHWIGAGYWLNNNNGKSEPFIFHNYKNYTRDDVRLAKEKLTLVSSLEKSMWEGTYEKYGELSEIRLMWDSDAGFLDYYIYTCNIELRGLNYGRVLESSETLSLVSEKPASVTMTTRKASVRKLVKVKVGEKHFLVPENQLANFCRYAVGLISDEFSEVPEYWSKVSDREKSGLSLPDLPSKYRSFLRLPIKAKIIKVGRLELVQFPNADKILEKDYVNYRFTINAGKNNGVRKDMNFYVLEMREWATIEKVSATSSVAFIQRRFSEGDAEICKDDEYNEHECGILSLGMTVQTQNSNL